MIINISLEQGIVPNAMKLAKVIPIYKAKSKQEFNNYRPISLLSNISKLLERVVHNRLYSFLTKYNVLYDSQYGFRPKRSTIVERLYYGHPWDWPLVAVIEAWP